MIVEASVLTAADLENDAGEQRWLSDFCCLSTRLAVIRAPEARATVSFPTGIHLTRSFLSKNVFLTLALSLE